MALERRWVSVPDMPRAVEAAAAVVLDGKLLVIGGFNTDLGALSAVLEYDPEDRSWKELPGLLTACSHCHVTVLGGDIVVIGGLGASDRPVTPTDVMMGHRGNYSSGRWLTSAERYNRRIQCREAMPSLTDAQPRGLPYFGALVVPSSSTPSWMSSVRRPRAATACRASR